MKGIQLLLTGMLLFVATSAGAVTLSLSPATKTIPIGSTFAIDLLVSGLGNNALPSVGNFDVDILYNPAQVAYTDYTLGLLLGDPSAAEALDVSSGLVTPGRVDLAEVSLLTAGELQALQPSTFILATLSFKCLGAGTSLIQIDPSNPLLTYAVGDQDGLPFQVTIGSAAEITQTPEPSTLLLLAGGFLGFALRTVRSRRSKST